jgi:hypothetical protein
MVRASLPTPALGECSHRGLAACGIVVDLPDHGLFGSRDRLLRFDGLDVVTAAAIPLRADPTAIRCGEMVEQVGHRIVRTIGGDEFVARKRGPPIALAARDKYDLALFRRRADSTLA